MTNEKLKIYGSLTKTLKKIRIHWKINGEEGWGLSVPLGQRETLEGLCAYQNKMYGPDTHWIEEIEV